uniref:Uncharacterized protein n=1 Tax=Acrobeloides nanus TaxID=290746 RepID=A0A914EF46_9BILA
MKTIFVVCLVIYATLCEGQTTRSPCPEAGINQITTCYAAYFRNYNFSSTPDFKTYIDTRYSILLKGGVDTFKLICQWHNTRLACIGSYDPVCATESAFAQALGVSSTDAAQYLSSYGLDNWECGPGYNDVVTNFYCIESLLSYHNDERLACNQAMNASIVQNGFSCSILRTFVQCYTKVYTKYCGQIGGYIGCNFAKTGSVELTPSCAPQLPNFCELIIVKKLVAMTCPFFTTSVGSGQVSQHYGRPLLTMRHWNSNDAIQKGELSQSCHKAKATISDPDSK